MHECVYSLTVHQNACNYTQVHTFNLDIQIHNGCPVTTHDLVAIGNHSQLNESVENSNVLIATVPGTHPEGAACEGGRGHVNCALDITLHGSDRGAGRQYCMVQTEWQGGRHYNERHLIIY